ncbi:MAG TPA: AAA family ATPase [Acidimicrobiales bacterium]|jgi:cell division protease FtsH|nr:AAA family ATPase [Acidimicrobiales bacterium]
MRDITSIVTRPEFLLPVLAIVGVTIAALRLTAQNRRAEQSHRPRIDHLDRVDDDGVAVHPGQQVQREPADRSASGVAPERPTVTFADVAGLDDAIAELREVTEYLSDPERFRRLGAELPRGILLHGLPGCGKTLLARALAGETGVPFYFVSASSFVEKFVGVGAARVRELFQEAKNHAPSIVFIDELDAVGRRRDSDGGGTREFDHTLNQLLVELDGFLGSSGVLLLAATNRPELIDPALLRPGRFDRRIEIGRPDVTGREKILRLHAAKRPFSGRVDWAEVAATTAGLSPAELANIVNEAALLAARRHHPRISPEDVEEAAARVLSGTRNSRLMDDDEKQVAAVHEAGHALLSVLVRGMVPPARVSIVGRTGAFDKSQWSPADDGGIVTKRELIARLIVLLGGRAAEVNTFGEPSTRAEDDLEQAAVLARRMVERLAMTGRYELAAGRRDDPHYFEGSAGGAEVRQLLAKSEQTAQIILRDFRGELFAIAGALVERETLSSAEVLVLAGRGSSPRPVADVRQINAG